MTKRRRNQDERRAHSGAYHQRRNHNHHQDDDFIPLPIQTFLWRQTSPFVRPFLGKARDLAQIEQRDACKLFERIIITNNIWGQSPSLTEAISSIDRWRLIKVSFPFVLQCTAALLNNKLIKDHNFNRLGGNEAKMMYTLQWILMNASEECADSENEAKSNATNVVFAAATAAASLLKPTQDPTQASGAINQQPGGGGNQPSSQQEQQQPLSGGGLSPGTTNQSIVIPAAAAVVAIGQPAGLSSLKSQMGHEHAEKDQQQQQQQQLQATSSSSVSPIGSSTPSQGGGAVSSTTPNQPAVNVAASSSAQPAAVAAATSTACGSASASTKYLLPVSSIQMFAFHFAPIMDGLKHSDFLSSNQRLEIGAALWEPLFNCQLPDIHCLKARIKRDLSEDEELEQQTPSSAVALVQQQQQRSTVKVSGQTGAVSATPATAATQITLTSGLQMGHDRRRSSSMFNDPAHFGDVFLGGPTLVASTPEEGAGHGASTRPGAPATSGAMSAHMEQSIALTKTSPATYLDVAILRCLFVSDWQEPGVFWSISYLANRFNEELYIKQDDSSGSSCDSSDWADSRESSDEESSRRHRAGREGRRRSRASRRLSRLALRRKSKSLSCISSDDLRRSLTLKRDYLRRQMGSRKSDVESCGFEAQDPAAGSSSRFLRVDETSGGASSETNDQSQGQKSPTRRLSFSSGMQTLANQIRKTSKRVKKSQDSREMSGETLAGGSQTNISQAEQVAFLTPRLTRPRRSSSADELSTSQLAALSLLQQDRQVTDSNPVITVTGGSGGASGQQAVERSADEQQPRKSKRMQTSKSSSKHEIVFGKQTSSQQQQDDCDQTRPSDDAGARQYLVQSLYLRSLKHIERLTRSQTIPANMRFNAAPLTRGHSLGGGSSPLDKSESLGADFYVDERGRIDPLVVLNILHSISQRENACSLRVCEKVLFLMNRLIKIGILKSDADEQDARRRRRSSAAAAGFNWPNGPTADGNSADPRANLLPTRRQHEFNLLHRVIQITSNGTGGGRSPLDMARHELIHKVLIDIVFRLLHHLGCPNHCGMTSTVDQHHKAAQQQQNFRQKVSSFSGGRQNVQQTTSAENLNNSNKNLRLSLRDSLEYLSGLNRTSFTRYMQDVFTNRNLQHVIDILHSLLGFCRPDYLSYLEQRDGKGVKTSGDPNAGGTLNSGPTNATAASTVQFAARPTLAVARQSVASETPLATSSTAAASGVTADSSMGQKQQLARRRKSVMQTKESVESIIVTNSFKQLITRMATMSKELKQAQNNSLYCDIRRLINFVRENYNSTFRSIVLSALIDCTRLLNKQQQLSDHQPLEMGQAHGKGQSCSSGRQQQQVVRRPSSEEESLAGGTVSQPSATTTTVRERQRGPDKQQVTSTTTDDELSIADSASLHHRSQHTRVNIGGASQRLGLGLGYQSPVPTGGSLERSQHSEQTTGQSSSILSLSKAKKKLEQVFGGVGGGGGSGGALQQATADLVGPSQQQQQQPLVSSMAQLSGGVQSFVAPAEDMSSPRTSLAGHHHQSIASLPHDHQILVDDQHQKHPLSIQIIKQNQLIYETVQAGMSNFAFLMESCLPGDFLDPAMLAALLDLKSPIAIRAAVFLECANFVHRCNRGQWPSWMRMNLASGGASGGGGGGAGSGGGLGGSSQQRSSNAGLQGGGQAAKIRKTSSAQRMARNNTLMYRAAGRAFCAWAEAVGARLEELLTADLARNQSDESKEAATGEPTEEQRHLLASAAAGSSGESLLMQDLDFLQPTIANDSSPFVLKMAACQLLFEVTTFLRETYRYLPPTIVQHQIAGSGKSGDKMSSIYDVSRAVTANRRWSMALSSLGFGQLPATLSALTGVGGGVAPQAPQQLPSASSRLANPNQSTLSEQPERRISFILHETKDTDQIREEEEEEVEGERDEAAARRQRDSMQGGDSNDQDGGLRRIASNSARHLSQSSASSAVVVAAATLLRSSGGLDSSTHRRKSIKLKKTVTGQEKEKVEKKTKFAAGVGSAAATAGASASGANNQCADFDEELENSSQTSEAGFRRSDSVRSRRRVSGISETSTNGLVQSQGIVSEAGATSAQLQQPQPQAAPQIGPAGELSGNESAGNGSQLGYDDHLMSVGCTESSLGKFEQDESKIMSHMPWFTAISLVNASIDCDCSHFPSCKPSCYKLHQSMSKRLISFVQTIYQDPTEQDYLSSIFEKRLANLISDQKQLHKQQRHQQQHSKLQDHGERKGVFRAGSDCSGAESGDPSQSAADKQAKKKDKKLRKRNQRQQADSPSQFVVSDHLDQSLGSPRAKISQSTMMIGGGRHHQHGFPSGQSGAGGGSGIGGGHFGHSAHLKLQPTSVVDETINILRAAKAKERTHGEEPPMIKYLRSNVRNLLHCPMSSFLKGAIILPRESFAEMIRFSWNLLLEDDQQLSRTAAVCFIVSSIKCPTEASKLLIDELESGDASRKMAAINKFYVVWDARYQCWPRLEDGAFVHFKMAPPSIEFTLPSPKIAQESSPVVDPPWMPRKTSNVEEVTIGQDQTVQKSFVTATKTRRKQQIELVTKALREKHDKLREDRENYNITSVPVTLYAAFEPTLGNQSAGMGAGGLDGELDGMGGGGGAGSGAGGGGSGANADEDAQQENRALFQMKTAQALFPTCLCQSAIVMINLLDDPRVTYEGSAVYETASKVIWSCLVEDPALFLRYFFERLTRQNQSTIFQVLRRLIRFMPRLPPQAAYTLYNYLIGFIIYYIRCPFENSQKLISDTLSVLCLVVPSVHGLFLKDLKQILRKEQCDHNLLITANVPSAKKIIIHGSDSSGIPSQFPIDESTQFYHVLVDSLEFFGIDKSKQNEYFLIDVRTNLMHNLHSYVRDYYSFKRSQHPQLQLINMDPSKAFDILQRQELVNQFMEFGKVLMSLSIVKSSHMAIQRALFLHEELMKLPTFPRKALETNFSLFRGPLGHQVFSMDRIHKICWVRVIARMFELTSGFFLQLGDIQLFLNAISGIFVLHCEEASVSRLCLATFINATHQFKSIFATDGFMPIMSTIVQVYSNHQNNQLLCRSIEFICKQFYIMHRKPFLLQLFGSVASKLNTAEILQHNQITSPVGLYQFSPNSQQQQGSSSTSTGMGTGSSSTNDSNQTNCYVQLNDPNRISPSAFFRLLLSLEKAFKDPLDILELVDVEKPLRAVDFCYQQDKESIEILDIISLCVTVTAYASESPRSTQMLIILESVVPLYMKHLQASTSKKAGQSMGKQAHKDELQKIQSISICIRTLIVNCEGLTRNFNGPLASFDFRSSSIRRAGPGSSRVSRGAQQQATNSAGSPLDIYADEPSVTGPETSKLTSGSRTHKSANESTAPLGKQTTFAPSNKSTRSAAASSGYNNDETEITRGEFIVPRDTLLNLVAEFLALSTGRLVESAKKYVDLHQKHSCYELLDVKSHLRLAEVANSLLKFASTDPSVMACRGLIRYMNEILPNTEWRQEAIRPALIMILKRLDKTFNRIAKKNWVRRCTDWEAAKQLLKGAYLTFIKHPYIVHLPHLKSLISCCQNIILSDGLQSSQLASNLLHGFAPAAAVGSAAAGLAATSQQQQVCQVGAGTSGGIGLGAGGGGSATGQSVATVGKFQASASNLLSVAQGAGTGARFTGKSNSPSLSSAGAAVSSGPQTTTPSLVAVTAAATLAERLAAGATSSSTHQVTSQGFNSVTIRLIAMQLLQTGDSQTLESFIGSSMNTPEKLESLMLNLIYPMCIRCCSGAREAPKLRVCDIMFILNIVLQMLAPQSASSKSCSSFANSPKATTDTSQFILSKITTTIGSTQTGATALNIVAGGSAGHSQASSHQIVQHQEALKIGFLGLKILCVCFESQLASEWVRISRVIRDLSLHSEQPSNPLWDFLDFVATYRFPMFVLLLPTIKCDIAKKVKQLERDHHRLSAAPDEGLSTLDQVAHYRQNLVMIEAKIHGNTPTVSRSKSFLFVSLTAELRMLKEQLIARRKQLIDGERNHHHLPYQTGGGASGSTSGFQCPGGSGAGGHSCPQGSCACQGHAGAGPSGPGAGVSSGGDMGGAYHRLSAAIASMGKLSPSASGTSSQLGTSAALKGAACFAAQLATSAPIGTQVLSPQSGDQQQQQSVSGAPLQSSIRLSTAKSREEARKMMNTILRRTSYPHNQPVNLVPQQAGSESLTSAGGERKGSQPASPSISQRHSPLTEVDIEAGEGEGQTSKQIIMDPAMLIKAAFPAAPRKSTVEGSGILKQLVQTIDRQNIQRQKQQTQRHQRTYRPTTQDQRAHSSSTR